MWVEIDGIYIAHNYACTSDARASMKIL